MAKRREEFDSIYKWDTKGLFENESKCKKEIIKIEKELKKIDKYNGNILANSNSLYDVLKLDSVLSQKLERVFIYAHINNDADTLNATYQELYGLAQNLYSKYLEKTSFIVPELLNSDINLIKRYIKENNNLDEFKYFFKSIFRLKKHILSKEEELVISSFAKLSSSPSEIMEKLTDTDFKFDDIVVDDKHIELNESNYSKYLQSTNREIRKQAFFNIYKTYSNYKHTLASIIKSEVDKNVAISKLRKYKSSLERALYNNEINIEVYSNLINSVHSNLKYLYDYFKLKKEVLKLKDFHIYDTYADIVKDSSKSYSFEEAKDLVLNAVKPLGEKYCSDLSKAFDEKWIDSCNNEGKRKGAYCTACYSTNPYVLLNYEGKLNDVSTLIHELGHAMHYYYAMHSQSYDNYNYSIFVAEVASQVNEILLCKYLLKNSTDRNEKLYIIDDLLQKFKSTIFRQTMFAEFELFMHEYSEKGGILTSDKLCDKYYELNKLYYGSDVVVDEEIKYEWERIPHFYMNFYVYQYATGFAAAVNIANNLFNNVNGQKESYLKFLKLGCTKNPIDSLKVAGIDMMNNKSFDSAMKFMNELIIHYKKLQGSDSNE